jgi:hypothetical protein
MFSLNDKVQILWGSASVSISTGTVEKITGKYIYLNQGAIRGQWIPRNLIRGGHVNGQEFVA